MGAAEGVEKFLGWMARRPFGRRPDRPLVETR
jgi:hypothetical protein